jgi:exopolysaccharide production protein ExoY
MACNLRSTNFGQPVGGAAKRAVDVTASFLALALLAPVIVLALMAVRIACGSSSITRRTYAGFNGRAYTCYEIGISPSTSHRATIEALLRGSGIDKAPQFFNVLRGDMSLIGPRPIATQQLGKNPAKERAYLRARPGLKGLWALNGRRSTVLDRYYVSHWSLCFDLKLMSSATFARLDDRS